MESAGHAIGLNNHAIVYMLYVLVIIAASPWQRNSTKMMKFMRERCRGPSLGCGWVVRSFSADPRALASSCTALRSG